ncbi:MAG: acyl-CoA dehydrogenase family protein [Acidimicrobiales bacterium]|jgi:alkylation response protein AidB-like acyl-CoA dehydrogenase|nr:acyl-CoA dehydrogenase family protein [Acidimicrobiales bacterium]HCK74228.1 acyl-CoA dehydrogenase [Acidimicrobiaceae bacterium]|tara:strand:+ start:5127 stop:6290 length:1164 start_codon:yes stop_codon:yes gene_type:complete
MTDVDVAEEMIVTLRDWVESVVIPHASEFELPDKYPTDMAHQMADFGLFGATIPSEYGGLDLDNMTYARVIEELSRGWMSLAGIINSHLICAKLISKFGSEEQKQRWLPSMATGELRGCFSLSEPDSGSDAGALRCQAKRDGDEWIINGTKMWVTNGEKAGVVALLARVPEGDPEPAGGISCFIVEKTPGKKSGGITVSRKIDKLGYRGLETVEMSYSDHRLSHDQLLGGNEGIGNGLRWALTALEQGRINVAARGVGVAQAAYDAALAYAKERETFGRPISQHQAIAFKLAEMATKLEAARLLTYEAARKADAGERVDLAAGMAKLFASETASELALDAMRIHGGNGFSTEYPVERYYRDAPLMIIGEGTSEIQKLVISRALLAED